MGVILGVDVGATTMGAGLVTDAGEVLYSAQRPTRAEGAGTALKTLLALVGDLVSEADRRRIALDGVGVGLPGPVDVARGALSAVTQGSHFPELRGVAIADEVERVTGLPVFVENDGNALALAAWIFGVGRGARSLVLFAIGTEVGGGVIVDGRLVRGARGFAGELHGIQVNLDGERCFCGSRGCLGVYIGGRAIADEARRRLDAGVASSVVRVAGGRADAVTSEHVFQAAVAGDTMSRAIVDRACEALGAAIRTMIASVNPEVVVVAGGVARSLVPLADEIRRHGGDTGLTAAFGATRIEVIGSDKSETVRGGAAAVLYHRSHGSATRA